MMRKTPKAKKKNAIFKLSIITSKEQQTGSGQCVLDAKEYKSGCLGLSGRYLPKKKSACDEMSCSVFLIQVCFFDSRPFH